MIFGIEKGTDCWNPCDYNSQLWSQVVFGRQIMNKEILCSTEFCWLTAIGLSNPIENNIVSSFPPPQQNIIASIGNPSGSNNDGYKIFVNFRMG